MYNLIDLDLHENLGIDNCIIIPVGTNCTVSIFLRFCGIKQESYPYDWATNVTIDEIIEVIYNKDNFNINNWFRLQNKEEYLPHDKDNDTHGYNENIFLNMDCLTKYKRRFDRLFNDIYNKDVILFHNYEDENDKITYEQKQKFREINPFISFIETHNFQNYSNEIGSLYKTYILTLIKPNNITQFIYEIQLLLHNYGFPVSYEQFMNDINIYIEKYMFEKSLFIINENIIFNNEFEIVRFLGNCLRSQNANWS